MVDFTEEVRRPKGAKGGPSHLERPFPEPTPWGTRERKAGGGLEPSKGGSPPPPPPRPALLGGGG